MRKLFATIRVRLTIWNSLVVLAATFLALFASREGMKYALDQDIRELLREELTELELAVDLLHPDFERIAGEFERKILGHSRHRWFARLIEMPSGKTVWQSENFPPEFELVPNAPLEQFSFRRTDLFFIADHPIETKSGNRFVVVLGEPTAFIKRDVWNLTKIILAVGSVVLLVAPIGGYFLAKNAMQPVREIVATTRSLEPTRLKSRLPIRGTGDELDQISEEINSFVDLISTYLTSQREFIANAAHELRSPLTAIQTSVEVCLTNPRPIQEYREQLEIVAEQCQSLRHLVNQLLELAETDAAMITTKQSLNLTELIAKSVSFFTGVADEKKIGIVANLDPDIDAQGDPTKLSQVANNLIDNAIKFTPRGGQIEVRLEHADRSLRFVVRDNGPGVPEHLLESVFERFYQTDTARNRDTLRGNGLGLSICRSIIEMHGGTIAASNCQPHGLQITVELPA